MRAEYIPNYALYGESRDGSSDIGIHIEEIAERSRGQDWVIKPHRHGSLFQILCIFDGESAIQLDDKKHQIDGWSLVTIPTGVVHGFKFKPDSQGVVITLSEDVLSTILNHHTPDYLLPVFENAAVVNMNSDVEQRNLLQEYLTLLRYEFSDANDAKFTSLLLLVNLLLITIKRQVDYQKMDASTTHVHVRTLDRFKRLIEKNFREHWQITDYASALSISTSTLNRVCQERCGINAKSIVLDRVITEAKRRLVYTQQPLDQIAYYLGFKDPAYFSRAFKKAVDVSPKEYRKVKQI